MNNKLKKVAKNLTGKNGVKNLVISIVILVELLAILSVATYAWVETVSSIKITTEDDKELEVDTYVFTEAMIGEGKGTIDLADYFKQGGDMHFAPCSSADGRTMFFPKVTSAGTAYVSSGNGRYRKGSTGDMNTSYLSVTFKLRADVNADFFFDQVPTFSNQSADMRVSVTSQSLGSLSDPETTIYKIADTSNESMVNSVNGGTASVSVKKIANHIKGNNKTKLFSVGAEETKIVTISVWLKGTSLDSNLPQSVSISNFGITSDLTPRHVTLIPTSTWDLTNTTEYYYAWCWNSRKAGVADRLYGPLTLDENEHYSFTYNGVYQDTLFIRCGRSDLTTADMSANWNTLNLWNKTADTTIPDSPVDPTYYIKTISGGSWDGDINGNKSTGDWALPDIVTIKTAYVTGQDTWGTLTSTSYRTTSVSSSEVLEANNASNASALHHSTIHALPGKKVRLTATAANSSYAFVGWYNNSAGTGTALSTSATYDLDASSEAPIEVTYYAKFKEIRTLTIVKYIDGVQSTSNTATGVGSITIGSNTSGTNVTQYSQTVDKGTSVSFSATPGTGYTFDDFYTDTACTDSAGNSMTLNSNTTIYANFVPVGYNVTARACYSTDLGSSYTNSNATGGTVKAGSSTAGATSTATVKYTQTVQLVATAKSGYDFVGWYDGTGSNATRLSTGATYTYTLEQTGAVSVYARFNQKKTTTIYMTYRGYSKMRIYIWGKDDSSLGGTEYLGSWNTSGNKPDYTGNRGLYSISFSSGINEDIGIIVYDGNNNSDRSEYTAHVGNTCLVGPSGSSINTSYTLGNDRYIYFTKKWTNNYLHYWGGSIGSTSWPGVNMTNKAYTNSNNEDVLYYVINSGNTAVIFHDNNGTQTGDTTLGDNSCFYFSSANQPASIWAPSTN